MSSFSYLNRMTHVFPRCLNNLKLKLPETKFPHRLKLAFLPFLGFWDFGLFRVSEQKNAIFLLFVWNVCSKNRNLHVFLIHLQISSVQICRKPSFPTGQNSFFSPFLDFGILACFEFLN